MIATSGGVELQSKMKARRLSTALTITDATFCDTARHQSASLAMSREGSSILPDDCSGDGQLDATFGVLLSQAQLPFADYQTVLRSL